jgi:hypothetical protein
MNTGSSVSRRSSTSQRAVLALLGTLMILGVIAGAVSAAPGETSLVSVSSAQVQGEGFSAPGNITPDGRFVSFSSNSTTLDPNDLDRFSDVYLRDLQTRTTTLVSVSSNGTKGKWLQRPALCLRRRALRRLCLGRHQPGPEYHQARPMCPPACIPA